MKVLSTVEEVEQLIRERGLSVARVCRQANISQTTFQRWKHGSDITLSTYNAVALAIETLSAQTAETTNQEPTLGT